ncbi:MAG: hypothetical protein ABI986_14240 [Chloroflexota bacterium]
MKLDKIFILGLLVMSLFVGIIIISIGFGSEFTLLNTIMSPLVCPGDKIIPAWEYGGPYDLVDGPDLRTRWICMNELTGDAHIASYRTIFTAGIVYGLLISGIVILRMWWVNRTDSNLQPIRE